MIKRAIKRLKLKLIDFLPGFIKGPLARSSFFVRLPEGKLTKIEYKMAESVEELNEAFKLIQQAYVDSKISSNPYEEKRILKYNLLPTTLVYIAKYKGEVIGTVSHIVDSEFGLPVDSFYEIDIERKTGKRIAEISGLAIKKNWRSHGAGIVVPLTLCSLKHSLEFIGIDYFFIVTNLNGKVLYENVFLFNSINNKNKTYNFANNAEGHVQVLKSSGYSNLLRSTYKKKKRLVQNLYLLWSVNPWKKQCHFSENNYSYSINPIGEKEHYSFALENFNRFKPDLTDNETQHLNNIYHLDEYKKHIKVDGNESINNRKDSRYLVNKGIKFLVNGKLVEGKILDVSYRGFLLLFEIDIEIPEILIGRIQLNSEINTSVKAKKSWSHGCKAGYYIIAIDFIQWMEFITFMDNEYLYRDDKEKSV